MKTAAAVVTISCPDWCQIPSDKHADDLWNMGGCCIHFSHTLTVNDPVGYSEPLSEPRQCAPIELQLTTTTTPEGQPQATPLIYIDNREHTIEQIVDLIPQLEVLVDLHRSERQP